MESKKSRLVLILGVAANLALLVFFIVLYGMLAPKENDLKYFASPEAPKIENTKTEELISSLKKVDSIPINIDPTEIGKSNPYNY